MTVQPHEWDFTVAGAGGKGGDAPSEAPNNLKSKQVARVVDLISEGPIRGLVDDLKGVLLDGTPLVATDGKLNFQNASVQAVLGYPDQPIMKGFDAQQSEQTVSVQLRYNVPITRSIINTDIDRARLTFSVPVLQKANDEGDIRGTTVEFKIECQSAGGGFQQIGSTFKISGKTNSRYQQAVMFVLPRKGPWDIRVTRLTKDSGSAKLQNDLYWDSFTEIIDDRVNYSHSACVGIIIDARQFQSIPKRTYHVDGLLVSIPSNYDPFAATYDGVWDGTFNFEWSNNPAWVFYDLILNDRYGLGDFVPPEMVNKWALYRIAQWCDGLVPDGKGGQERRFTCNMQIATQIEAFDLLAQIASIFRGFAYWSGGEVVAVADQPTDAGDLFTNANVLDGQFSYSGTDRRARHSMAAVSWRDPAFLGETRLAVVENQEMISRYGIQKVDVPAVGCTSEGQAHRTGKWTLYTEQYETDAVQFTAGLDSVWVRPGAIIRIMDATIAGTRRGGRVAEGSTAALVKLDAPVDPLPTTPEVYLSCVIGEGLVETRPVILIAGDQITVDPPFTQAPAPGVLFVLSAADEVEPTLWRVLGIKQTERDQYEVSAVSHNPGKWDAVEHNIVLTEPDTSILRLRPEAVTGVELIEYMVQTSPISVAVHATVSWISTAPLFDVTYRREDDNWATVRVDSAAVDLVVTEGIWQFQITPVSPLGLKGPTTSLQQEIIGRFAPPSHPLQFRVNVVGSVAMFDWLPATEIDVVVGGYYELRHSSRTSGADWYTAQTVIPSIPGSATSCEAGYQPGTWFLRTYDIVGTPSETWAVVLALLPDSNFTNFVRVCEQPDWLGVHDNTTIKMPQEWLTIDVLDPLLPAEGTYYFDHVIDAGGVFSVRLSADILAFQFAVPDDFIDSRIQDCDTWSEWDSLVGSMGGEVTILISQTDEDPTGVNPNWTPWKTFIAGEHYARAFRFAALLTAPAGQNIGVEELCILADMRAKIDEGGDVSYPAADTRITFAVKFFLPPAVVVTVQNAMENDRVQIIDKTNEYFDIRITGSPDGVTQKTRTFDWHAQGY